MQLTFKIQPAKEHGRSQIEIILFGKGRVSKTTTENTDLLLPALDKLLKKNKIKLESLKDIKVEIYKEAGLTTQRIVLAICKALCLNL